MKKVISLVAAIALMIILLPLGTVTQAASQEVTLPEGGSLADALAEVADGGTIYVDGTVSVTADPGTHGKTVTITGGELDFSSLDSVTLGDHITFDNITLTFNEGISLYAGGYKVKMGADVTMTNPIKIFGGKKGGTVASTNLTLLAGTYVSIYGGSYNGNVTGDTYLYVGGDVNSGIDETSHSHTYCVYGGSYIPSGSTRIIGGTAYTVFTGNAKANYLYGGSYGDVTISGGTNVTISGGSLMSVYGANRSGSFSGDVKLLISSGTMEQVFGGSEGSGITGDVALDITGGTITRRVYGGCYNNYDGSWSSAYYVTGNIVLTLHSGANIDFSSSYSDEAIFAHSRQATLSGTEVSHLVYADSTAYNNYKSKVAAQDLGSRMVMGSSTKAADYIHYHTYTASGAVITQSCIASGCSATATVVVEGTPTYNGSAVEPAKVTYSDNWFGGDLAVAYANNESVGTGTASITCGGATASLDFTIVLPGLSMNGVGYGSLEDAIEAARQTPGADTITLWQDLEVASWLVINTDVTITADHAVTITAADSQTGGMIRIIDGTFTVAGASEEAKITLAAGKNTTHIISNNGGNVILTNVHLAGNENTAHVGYNRTHGIFNDTGTLTARSVDITNIVAGDSIYVLDDTTVNLDNVAISGSGRYGIKVKGTVNIYNTVHPEHGLSISNTGDNAIDIENGGKLISSLNSVPADAYAIKIFENAGKGINVRGGGNLALTHVSVTDAGTYGICFSNSAGIGASGTISDFQVSEAGKSAVYIEAHSTATLTNGTIATAGYCVKTEANSTLTASNVTVQSGGDAATVIKGNLSGEITEAA